MRMRILGAMILAVMFTTIHAGAADTYGGRLRSMSGDSYRALSCTGYICAAKRHRIISAKAMLTSGELIHISASELREGDIEDFHGVHVAAYLGGGVWYDSTPESGVGPVHHAARDPWYSGTPTYLRWKS